MECQWSCVEFQVEAAAGVVTVKTIIYLCHLLLLLPPFAAFARTAASRAIMALVSAPSRDLCAECKRKRERERERVVRRENRVYWGDWQKVSRRRQPSGAQAIKISRSVFYAPVECQLALGLLRQQTLIEHPVGSAR